jgi:predicted Zn-dependent protease
MIPALFVIGATYLQTPNTTPAPAPPVSKKEQDDEKAHEAAIADDVAQGKKAAEEAEKKYHLSTNKEWQDRVARIGATIAAIANAGPKWNVTWGDKHFSKFDYTYKVLQGDDVNAFSLPGGHIYVFEGLMKQIESDDELAGVLGHETAHAAFRHVATLEHNADKMNMVSLPLILLSLLVGGGVAAPYVVPGVSLGQQTVASGWSVQAEEAADYGGMQFLLKSKYDPTGMLTFMERLAIDEKLQEGGLEWGIYRDHPPSEERAQTLTNYITQAGRPIRRSRVTTSFRVTMHPADDGTVELDFGKHALFRLAGSDAITRADQALPVLNDFFDSTPELYEIQPGPAGSITWRGKSLLTLAKADADAAGDSLPDYQQKAVRQVQVALFTLGFHVWQAH